MEEIRLEVGKIYQSGRGDVVQVIERSPGMLFEFKGDNGVTYTKEGAFSQFGDHPLDDLVKEINQTPVKG